MICEILLVAEEEAAAALRDHATQAARSLRANGFPVRDQMTHCPTSESLAAAIASGLARSNILLIVGGMGPESGFLSKRIVAQGLRMPLADDARCLSAIKVYCERTGDRYLPEDVALASLPREARAFLPHYGKLPGCIISSSRQHIVLLPENPRELLPMLQSDAIPALRDAGASGSVSHYVRAVGIGYERASGMLSDLTAAANPVVTVEEDGGEVLVRVGAGAPDAAQASELCRGALSGIVERLGDYAYGLDVDSLEAAVVAKMRKKGLGLAIAENGTNGMLTRVLSETERGQEIVRYSVHIGEDEEKLRRMGIPPRMLRKRGVVSEYAAVAMANAAREKVAADIGVAVSAAPPEHGNRKNTGFVYIAVVNRDSAYVKKLVVATFDEADGDAVIDASVARALNMVRLFVDYLPGHYRASVPLWRALEGKKSVTDQDTYGDDAFGDDAFGDILIRPRQTARAAFFGNFVIRRADRLLTKMKKFIFILATLTFLGCAGYLGYYYYGSFSAQNANEKLKEIYYEPVPAGVAGTIPDYPEQYGDRFAKLWMMNNDIVGFLKIEGTAIDYPVVQGEDNQYYMRRAFDGSYSEHGVPFLDFRADIERPSDNLVVYGHNMHDGQAFADLLGYRELEFLKEHPQIQFNTLHQDASYVVFAVFITNAFEETGRGEVFNYHDMVNAATPEDFEAYAGQLRVRSLFDTGVEVIPGDELLTLSTCSYDFTDARFVVVARLLREDEDSVDLDGAKPNPNPLYPDIWYETYGGDRPDVPSASIATTSVSAGGSSAVLSSVVYQSGVTASEETAASRLASESAAAEASRLASESAAAEASRLASESAAAEASRLASESAAAEASRLASESAAAEASRLAAASAAEVSRLASESAAAEASRLAAASAAQSAAAEAEAKRKQNEKTAEAAATQAEDAYFAAYNALDRVEAATNAQDAAKHAKTVREAAAIADEAAAKAETAAKEAGTDAAKRLAGDARVLADEAGELADMATLLADELATRESASEAASGSGVKLEKMTIYAGGVKYAGEPLDIVARVVQNEIGSAFHTEAIKAQAVAAYTYIMQANSTGGIPTVSIASKVDAKVKSAVESVLGEAVYYKGAYAFTTYFSTSAGATTSSQEVWGGSYPYLVSVDSSIEERLPNFSYEKVLTKKQVEELLRTKLGITASGSPSGWFETLDHNSGGYNGRMRVCGNTKSPNTGNTLTGRLLRESVLSLRSACFEVDYDSRKEQFTFTTYGYGHGVGLSQNGANLYAQEGWSYIDILEHYYPGTTVK